MAVAALLKQHGSNPLWRLRELNVRFKIYTQMYIIYTYIHMCTIYRYVYICIERERLIDRSCLMKLIPKRTSKQEPRKFDANSAISSGVSRFLK